MLSRSFFLSLPPAYSIFSLLYHRHHTMSSLLVVQHLVKRGLVPQLVASGVRTAYQSARNPYRFSAMAPKLLAAQRRCLTSSTLPKTVTYLPTN